MKLDPETLAIVVPEAVGVRTETMHVAIAFGYAAIAHGDGDLMQGFGQQGPEVPVVAGAAQVGARITLDGLVQVGELARVAYKKYRRVVAHQIPVAFIGIKLEGKAANVALGIGGTALAGHGAETGKHFGFLAHFAENAGARVFCNVIGDGKRAKSSRALGVHAPLGNRSEERRV